jgi:hypothetical protein
MTTLPSAPLWPQRLGVVTTLGAAFLLSQCSKDPAAQLPELTAEYAARLTSVANTDLSVIAPAPAEPQARVTTPRPTVIYKECAAHSTEYAVDAIYPILICQPLGSSLVSSTAGALERTLPMKGPHGSWVAEPAFRYRVASANDGHPKICAYARMPVGADLIKTTTCDQNLASYRLDLNGLTTVVWNGPKDNSGPLPPGLILLNDQVCISDVVTQCGTLSNCQPNCGPSTGGGDGGGISPAATSNALRTNRLVPRR